MSALPPEADIRVTRRHVCYGPKGDIERLCWSTRSKIRRCPTNVSRVRGLEGKVDNLRFAILARCRSLRNIILGGYDFHLDEDFWPDELRNDQQH